MNDPSAGASSTGAGNRSTRNRRKKPGRGRGLTGKIALAVVLIAVIAAAFAFSALRRALSPSAHENTAQQPQNLLQTAQSIAQIASDPMAGFPGKNRINILCMGIDDNWTDQDVVFTHNARTDTLFLLSLDLANKKATVLSIPRDSYVPIAGTSHSDKINAAYATGGPVRSEATVAQVLGVNPDYYIVLNIDATKRMVDALGGVDVDVEHAMDYDDNWGHLHVHLQPGFQHLDGNQAMSFARYRHGNHTVSPEDGDERRMYRQHVLLRAMIAKAKTFSNVLQVNNLIDTGVSCIHTNMTRTQLADLVALYHSMQDSDMITAQIPAVPFTGPHGASDMVMDDKAAQLYVAWLIGGDESAGRALTPVVVENGTNVNGLAQKAVDALRANGYAQARIGRSASTAASSATSIVDTGVPDSQSAHDVATLLGVPQATLSRKPVQPNRLGWAPPAAVDVTLGSDYAGSSQLASAGAAATTPTQ